MVCSGVRCGSGDLYGLLAALIRARAAHGDSASESARVVVGACRESLSLEMVRQHILCHFALQHSDEGRALPTYTASTSVSSLVKDGACGGARPSTAFLPSVWA